MGDKIFQRGSKYYGGPNIPLQAGPSQNSFLRSWGLGGISGYSCNHFPYLYCEHWRKEIWRIKVTSRPLYMILSLITFDSKKSKLEEEQMAGSLRPSGSELQSLSKKFIQFLSMKWANQSFKLLKNVSFENANKVADCAIPILFVSLVFIILLVPECLV